MSDTTLPLLEGIVRPWFYEAGFTGTPFFIRDAEGRLICQVWKEQLAQVIVACVNDELVEELSARLAREALGA